MDNNTGFVFVMKCVLLSVAEVVVQVAILLKIGIGCFVIKVRVPESYRVLNDSWD